MEFNWIDSVAIKNQHTKLFKIARVSFDVRIKERN